MDKDEKDIGKFVYVIGPSGGPLKLGISKNVDKRRRELNGGNPKFLKIFYEHKAESVSDAEKIEKFLHFSFSVSHIRGEWFKLVESDLPRIIQEIQNCNVFDYDSDDWSLDKKSCDEFTSEVCGKARRALNMEPKELADIAGVALDTLIEFEAGKRNPRLETLEKLKDALVSKGVEFVQVQPGKALKILI